MGIIVDSNQYDPKLFVYSAPFEPRGESAVSEQIALAMIPAEQIMAIRPPLPAVPNPNVPKLPPPTISEIIGVPTGRRWSVDGPRGKPEPRPEDPAAFSASARYTMGSVSPYG